MNYFNESLITWGDLTQKKQDSIAESYAETVLQMVDETELATWVGADAYDPARVDPDSAREWAMDIAYKNLERDFHQWTKVDIPKIVI